MKQWGIVVIIVISLVVMPISVLELEVSTAVTKNNMVDQHPLDDPIGIVPDGLVIPDKPAMGGLDIELQTYFVENRGNFGKGGGRYVATGEDISIALGDRWISFDIRGPDGEGKGILIRAEFQGANPSVPQGQGLLPHDSNYFIGDEPSAWVLGASSFREVYYSNLWDSIDLRVYFQDGLLKYDFVVLPGGEAADIIMSYNGSEDLEIEGNSGDLLVRTSHGDIRDRAPVAFQEAGGFNEEIECDFNLIEAGTVGFDVGGYDKAHTLTIDPTLDFSTFIGGSLNDAGTGIAIDSDGNYIVSGSTYSSNFPTSTGAYDDDYDRGGDFIIAKLSNNGSTLLYSTFIGGNGNDLTYDVALDPDDNIYVIGRTYSSDFPKTTGAYDEYYNGGMDIAVVKLNRSGSSLDYSTFIGGSGDERGLSIDVDASGCAYVTGISYGSGLPTNASSIDPTFNGGFSDAFALKVSPDGSRLEYITYMGGTSEDQGRTIVAAGDGSAYITGHAGANFPTTAGAFDRSHNGDGDVFIAKINASGAKFDFCTYYGREFADYGEYIYLDPNGDVWVVGETTGWFPTTSSAYDTSWNLGNDGFMLCMNANCSDVKYSSYLGGIAHDYAGIILGRGEDELVIAGETTSTDFPTTTDAIDRTHNGNYDIFVTIFNISQNKPTFSTFIGGSGEDRFDRYGEIAALDELGNIIVNPHTRSTDFPKTTGAFDEDHNGNDDINVFKIRFENPPKWGDVPSLSAVEDIPFTFDFSGNVSDIDTPLDQLLITSSSSFVESTSGLSVTFLFPNGVIKASVQLILKDSEFSIYKSVTFNITPVNDPPDHDIETSYQATEDVTLTLDLASHVWDVDNDRGDLSIEVDDPYASLSGFNLTVMFPEGVLEHNMTLLLSDGELSVQVPITFTVRPVDDPPMVSPIDDFTAIEDLVSVFNLTPYLSDIDTPLEDLSVIVRNPRCTVVGQEIHFHYSKGGFNETVQIQVTDGRTMVEANMTVFVSERNDAPIVHPIDPQMLTEDTESIIDLEMFVEDEDTDYEDMTLTCDHPAVVGVSGMNVTLLFTSWVPEQTIYINVSDGFLKTEGQFLVQVEEVNDAPVITGIGGLTEPVVIEIDEGTSEQYQVNVYDEDDHNFAYMVSSQWSGVTITRDGMLNIEAEHGDVGEFEATVKVTDPSGAEATIGLTINVVNVNDPPTVIDIMKPSNHTIVDAGVNISFSVSVSDPDMMFGQVLTVTWISNISGQFKTLTTEDELSFLKDDLPVGEHRITVHVTDGEHVREAWFDLTVMEPYVPPPPPEPEPFYRTSSGLGLIIGVVAAVVLVIAFIATRPRSEEEREEESLPSGEDEDIMMEVVEGSQRYEVAALGEELGRMADELEESKKWEEAPAEPEKPAALDLEDVVVPSAEELAEREHAGEVREVMRTLTQLPRGLPTSLIDYDLSALARLIADGPKKEAPDGTLLVEIDGKWYTADHRRTSTFLQEWREPSRASGGDARRKKLEQLEERLLEGKISEETYRELRKKYEDE